jgi:CBS domain-containing protein
MDIKQSRVSDWMTANPISITPETNLPKAHQLMKEYKVRRLPVVDNGILVGIVTLGDIREASPSDATALSIYELNYLLSNLTVRDIMTPNPVTVSPSTSLHDAAKLMLEKKIGGLPVMDEGALVGIMTESDVFRAVMEIFT